jgi:hypothetical protein
MIRDPSDGSVREPQKPEDRIMTDAEIDEMHRRAMNCPYRNPDCKRCNDTAGPVIDTATSGLQTGSSKPENLARLEKSREWLKDYFHRKTEGT